MPDYYLFGTESCHLCEQAEQLVDSFKHIIVYKKKDIIDNPEWTEKYAIRIPVLYHRSSHQELGWPFDEITLQQFIHKNINGESK